MNFFFSNILFFISTHALAIPLAVKNIDAYDYTGDIDNKHKINVELTIKDNKIHGSYFYHESLQDIKLSGDILENKKVRINEFDDTYNITAVFEGTFLKDSSEDPRHYFTGKLDTEVFIGIWYKTNNKNHKLPVYFKMENSVFKMDGKNRYAVAGINDINIFESNVRNILQHIKSNNKSEVSKSICYPIYVKINGTRCKINNTTELYKIYDKVFTNVFISKINESIPHKMFANSHGVMLGGGIIWFSGLDAKIIAINN